MKKLYAIVFGPLCSFLLMGSDAAAQAFRKGSLLVSLTEGTTWSKYSTRNTNAGSDVMHSDNINGDRDPLTVEYGLSDKWGIGLNMGGDLFKVDPNKFYGFETSHHYVTAIMSEFTIDGNYHFFVTKRLDLSAFASVGVSSVSFKGNDGDHAYKYESGGLLGRTGMKAKYYFFRRLGATAMLSAFSTKCSTEDVKDNTVGQGYSTTIKGAALEFGLCYRILR